MMRASANHWGWYGVLQVLIPTALFSVLIWALELYFFNSAIKSLGANLFETPADLQSQKSSIPREVIPSKTAFSNLKRLKLTQDGL